MQQHHGFSLTEVLVSLVLLTLTSLALLTHEWHVSQLYNQVLSRMDASRALDRACEHE